MSKEELKQWLSKNYGTMKSIADTIVLYVTDMNGTTQYEFLCEAFPKFHRQFPGLTGGVICLHCSLCKFHGRFSPLVSRPILEADCRPAAYSRKQ